MLRIDAQVILIKLWHDFKTFYAQYDLRRHRSLDVFPKILTDWVDTIDNLDKR